MDILRSSIKYLSRTAVLSDSKTYKYSDILKSALKIASIIENIAPRPPLPSQPFFPSKEIILTQPRIALFCDPGPEYVAATLATWLRSGIAVPLALSHPDRELSHVLNDSTSSAILTTTRYIDRMRRLVSTGTTHSDYAMDTANVFAIEHTFQNSHHYTATPPDQDEHHMVVLQQQLQTTYAQHNDSNNLYTKNTDEKSKGALIVYTSGTTGRPKGVLHTHSSINTQISTLKKSWEWHSSDTILHCLPLHHIHGIVNALYCALESGATVEFMDKFSPMHVWERLIDSQELKNERPITVFMGVPTMYSYMLHVVNTDDITASNTSNLITNTNNTPVVQSKNVEKRPSQNGKGIDRKLASKAAQSLRLTISGSAACPLPVMNDWKALTGHYLLERYGMTETGMILGNPLRGRKIPGSVGIPFDGVNVKICSDLDKTNEDKERKDKERKDEERKYTLPELGELCVSSDQLFSGYWCRPDATSSSFDSDGWFHTGDTVITLSVEPTAVSDSNNENIETQEHHYYKILGRTSVDIIKCKGYKVSALEIESVLLVHPNIKEIAVVGVPDNVQGEKVIAVVVASSLDFTATKENSSFLNNSCAEQEQKENVVALSMEKSIKAWAKKRLAPYEIPSNLIFVEKIPRNAMGKVNKKTLLGDLSIDTSLLL